MTAVCMEFLYGMMNIQLTLKQDGFELCGSTYTWIFFNGNTTTLYHMLLVEPMDIHSHMQGTNYNYR